MKKYETTKRNQFIIKHYIWKNYYEYDSPYRRHRDLVLGLNNGNKNDNTDSIKYRSSNLKNENDSISNLLSISNIATVGIMLILLAALSILIVLFD